MIAIASDHAGYELKLQVMDYLKELNEEFYDYGAYSLDSCDYPDFAIPACKSVADGASKCGILICGTGIGMSMVANKIAKIRCGLCVNEFTAIATREHNNANVLAFGARVVDLATAKVMVKAFLTTEFLGGRHARRVDKVNALDQK
ncbi:MAG: ribose 5-phosphate isomerase B [Clostridia bacterium]